MQIITAAMELHSERGVLVTNWEEIAARAGVSTATAYRHFPSLGELVPACARTVFDIIKPPTIEEATVQFATLPTATDRLELLVVNSCHCYSAGEGWLHAAYRERDFVPALDEALGVIEGTLETLVRAAAGGSMSRHDRDVLFVMCNFPFWKLLRDQNFSYRAALNIIVRLVQTEAVRIGLD